MTKLIDFDLTLFLKETEIQHGMRAQDYTRYHHYLTKRLATLRRQLNLSNDKKKFLRKEVTVSNTSDSRHLMLLALYAERCWAAAESQEDERRKVLESQISVNKPAGGISPPNHYRKRLKKSLKWAQKLNVIAESVASTRLQAQCKAYRFEIAGRAATAQRNFKQAKEAFMSSRDIYVQLLRNQAESDNGSRVLFLKANEMDDRVVHIMQQLHEDVTTYKHLSLEHSGQYDAFTSIHWNGQELRVTNVKIRDALREACNLPIELMRAKVLDVDGIVSTGQVNKLLKLMDRRMSSYNEALTHVQQDLRAAPENTRSKTQSQLVVHYLLYEIAKCSMYRSLFLAEISRRRFHATERALARSSFISAEMTKINSEKRISSAKIRRRETISPRHFTSPLEVVRLYEAALDAVEQMEILPGVSGRKHIEELLAVCRGGKFLYMGEAFRVARDMTRAQICYHDTIKALDSVTIPEGKKLYELAERMVLEVKIDHALRQLSSSANFLSDVHAPGKETNATNSSTTFLTDVVDKDVTIVKNVVKFPPDYQAVACKPVFVDIAFTYLSFPNPEEDLKLMTRESDTSNSLHSRVVGDVSTGQDNNIAPGSDRKKWRWGWGW